ncbi:hypothetical protein [Novosphingobium guangzhouense]|jgi:hypothetical protein|uniref:hypothetical protein n=1 Tax=Novosphingobium guangzhouense TaxID=1850347 RepID=UPI000CCC6C5E|nr:hypothetical protein [Novosphingobium guangzhouense]
MTNTQISALGRLVICLLLCATTETGAFANGPPSPSPINGKSLLAKMDADRDGRISSTEWRLQSMPMANFRKLDRNHDGFVTLKELVAKPPKTLDASRDGKLSPREMTFGKAAKKIAPRSKRH